MRNRATFCTFFAILAIGNSAPAQPITRSNVAFSEAPTVEESPEIANLLRVADEAVARADWKLAIDSLTRVIANPEGLRSAGNDAMIYESPRRHAYRMLASLPDEGLKAYRILHDGRAKGLLEQARANYDVSGLQRVCEEYLLTSHGLEAAELLASWLIDLGRETEAAYLLDDIAAVLPGDDALPDSLNVKRALAARLMGDETAVSTALGDISDPGLAGRIETLLNGLNVRKWGDSPIRRERWTGPGGGGPARGMMPAVDPLFAERSPWRQPLPSSIAGLWPELDALSPSMLPVTQPITDDGRLFVKSGDDVVAIDLHSFALLWISDRGLKSPLDRQWGKTGTSEERLLSDYVAGSLSTAFGLVFDIHRDETQLVPANRNQRVRNRQVLAKDKTNTLFAFDAVTGRVRWSHGRAGEDGDDLLEQVQFLAPPVAASEALWVPFEQSRDIFLAVLDPETGQLLKRIFLCTLAGRDVNSREALFPAVADGVIYVPTGHGLLFAVDAASRSIRWASRYRVPPPFTRRQRWTKQPQVVRAAEWLSGPPVVTSSLVLLAPTDDDRLIALDRLSGVEKWSVPRGQFRYIIAAAADRAWLGGSSVGQLLFADLDYAWAVDSPGETARAVLSGDRIYVPTQVGLSIIDADSGEAISAYELPADQPPLGNLLCMGGSMISLDPSEVRAFPDRDSYDQTLAAHQADPTDARLAIRIAFMELWNGSSERALEALAEVDVMGEDGGEMLARHVAHLSVESLINLGESVGLAPEKAIEYLRRAADVAVERSDRTEAVMALGRRLRVVGRFRDAYETLMNLGLTVKPNETVSAGDTLRNPRIVIARELRRIEPELGGSEIERIASGVREIYETGRTKLSDSRAYGEGIRALRNLADCGLLGGWDQAALNELGRFELSRGKIERAQQHLLESVHRGSVRERSAEALLILAEAAVDSFQNQHLQASELLDRLMREYVNETVSGEHVPRLVAKIAKRVDEGVVAAQRAAMDSPIFELTRELAFERPGDRELVSLVDVRDGLVPELSDRALFLVAPRTLRCRSVVDGSLLWESELLLDEFAFETPRTTAVRMEQGAIMVDGQTAVINSRQGLHAVGLLTGLRLWAVPFDGGPFFGDPVLRNDSTDAGAGVVAYLSAPRQLDVRRLLDGELRWRRMLRGKTIGSVRIRDDYVLTADPVLENVAVYRVDNGDALCEIKFDQPKGRVIPISYHDGVLCGPSGSAIEAFDVRTGERLWRLDLSSEPVWLFEPTEGHLVASVAGGYHWLVETGTGEILLEKQTDAVPGGARLGTEHDGVLVLAGLEETREGDRWHIAGFDPADGRELWRRDYLGPKAGPQFRLVKGAILMAALTKSDSGGRGGLREGVVILDVRTGNLIGSPVFPEMSTERLTGRMAVWPGRLALQTTKGVVTLRTNLAGRSAGVN